MNPWSRKAILRLSQVPRNLSTPRHRRLAPHDSLHLLRGPRTGKTAHAMALGERHHVIFKVARLSEILPFLKEALYACQPSAVSPQPSALV